MSPKPTGIKWKQYAIKAKKTQKMHLHAKYNFRTSFVKVWNAFVSYSAILVTMQKKI